MKNEKENRWIKKLKSEGVKAAHYEDGWVNEGLNAIHLKYPYFGCDGSLTIGDRIALGEPDSYRVVAIKEKIVVPGANAICMPIDVIYWKFE